MYANAKALFVIAACALVVQAQSSTTATAPASQSSPATPDTCIVNCVTAAAASAGCSSFTDLSCVCTSTSFQQQAGQCLQANCTTSDIQAAQQLQQQECAGLSSSGVSSASSTASSASLTASGVSSTTSTSKSSGTSAPASASPAQSSSAAMLSAPFSLGGLVGTLVASAGALVGAAFIL